MPFSTRPNIPIKCPGSTSHKTKLKDINISSGVSISQRKRMEQAGNNSLAHHKAFFLDSAGVKSYFNCDWVESGL